MTIATRVGSNIVNTIPQYCTYIERFCNGGLMMVFSDRNM
jgi:hypothetical protein